jgi:hypothetical protein
VKQIAEIFAGQPCGWRINKYNEFVFDMAGVKNEMRPQYRDGRVIPVRAFVKGAKVLPIVPPFAAVVAALNQHKDLRSIVGYLDRRAVAESKGPKRETMGRYFGALEAFVAEGWVKGSFNKKFPTLGMTEGGESDLIYYEREAPAGAMAMAP